MSRSHEVLGQSASVALAGIASALIFSAPALAVTSLPCPSVGAQAPSTTALPTESDEGPPISNGDHFCENWAGFVLEDGRLAGFDFRRADLSSARFTANTVMRGVDLTGADISGAVFSGDGSNMLLVGATGVGASLGFSVNDSFIDMDATNANLTGGTFSASYLRSVFAGAILIDSDWSFAFASDVDFTDADLGGATFLDTGLSGATFRNANLQNAVFGFFVDVRNADFRGADLRDITIDSSVRWTGATYDRFTQLPSGFDPDSVGMVFVIPEPSTSLLVLAGFAGLGIRSRTKRQTAGSNSNDERNRRV